MDTSICVHRPTITVQTSGTTIWLHVPLSDDGTARVAVFLDGPDAAGIAVALAQAADRVKKIRAIETEAA